MSHRFLARFPALACSLVVLCVACSSSSGDSTPPPEDTGAPGDASADALDVASPNVDDTRGGVDGAPTDSAAPPGDGGPDALAASFVFVGCNRLQKADWDPTTNPI